GNPGLWRLWEVDEMCFKLTAACVAGVIPWLLAATTIPASADDNDRDNNRNAPVSLLTVIQVPGNPVTSADIAWVDPGTERYYFADRSNFGVEVIDAEKKTCGWAALKAWRGLCQVGAAPAPRTAQDPTVWW